MNFLVTGGAGFIGSHVCERLLRTGHAVWAFDDLNPFYDPQLKRATPPPMSEGRFEFFAKAALVGLHVPQTDNERLWP